VVAPALAESKMLTRSPAAPWSRCLLLNGNLEDAGHGIGSVADSAGGVSSPTWSCAYGRLIPLAEAACGASFPDSLGPSTAGMLTAIAGGELRTETGCELQAEASIPGPDPLNGRWV